MSVVVVALTTGQFQHDRLLPGENKEFHTYVKDLEGDAIRCSNRSTSSFLIHHFQMDINQRNIEQLPLK